jgi:NitT/TauT family transport system substrate-binding protein
VVSLLAGVAAAALVCATAASAAGTRATFKVDPSIKGQRFVLVIDGTGDASKVVETHAVGILKSWGVDASVRYDGGLPNVAIAQLVNGDADAFAESISAGVGAAIAGVPLEDFALLEPRMDYTFISRPGITSIAQLKGQKIGVSSTTGVNYPQALMVLKKGQMDQNDVSIIVAGGQSSRLAALVAGRIDATMLSHLAWLQLQSQGYHMLWDYTKQTGNLYDDNTFATKAWLASHKALATAFNEAILLSYKWFDDPKNANAIVQDAVSQWPASDASQIGQLYDILRQSNAYPQCYTMNLPTLKYQAALFEQLGAIHGSIPIGNWVNVAYANAARKAVCGNKVGSKAIPKKKTTAHKKKKK